MWAESITASVRSADMPESHDERALRTACTEFADIPDQEWRYFWSQVRPKVFGPRRHLVREGQPAPCVHFIVSGLVRLYYNREGRELVRGFDYENRWVTAYESVLTGEPAMFSIETLEPTRTLSFTADTLRLMYNRHPCWDRFGRRILEAQWLRQSDAMQLPFADREFDVVVCQFGVMFFPDKAKAFAEARRVLRDGGVFLFSVWDRIETNEFADDVTRALASLFPADPPAFLRRTPHGYFEPELIERDLNQGGFENPKELSTVAERSRAESAMVPAIAYCQGTPLRNEIEARAPSGLNDATTFAADAVARRFGRGSVDGKIQAHIVAVRR